MAEPGPESRLLYHPIFVMKASSTNRTKRPKKAREKAKRRSELVLCEDWQVR